MSSDEDIPEVSRRLSRKVWERRKSEKYGDEKVERG